MTPEQRAAVEGLILGLEADLGDYFDPPDNPAANALRAVLAEVDRLRGVLSEGLNLCVRARKLDAQQRTNDIVDIAGGEIDLERYAPRHNWLHPDAPVNTRCATVHLWVQDQYDTDLAAWERRARTTLSQPSAGEPK